MIDVIILTYNHKEYISQCLNSVLLQDLSIINKILIADDCSNDGTSELCNKFQIDYPNKIEHIKQKVNIGLNLNFKFALTKISAKYFIIQDGDDYFLDSNKLKKQYSILESNEKLIGTAHAILEIDENNKIIEVQNISQSQELIFNYKSIGMNRPFHTNTLLTKSIIIDRLINYDQFFYCNDLALINLLLEKGSIQFTPEKLSVYRRHSSANSIKDSQFKYFETASLLYKKLKQDCNSKIIQKQYAKGIQLLTYQRQLYLAKNNIYPYTNFKDVIRSLWTSFLLLKSIKKSLYPIYLFAIGKKW